MTARKLAVLAILTSGCAVGELPDPPSAPTTNDTTPGDVSQRSAPFDSVVPTTIELEVSSVDWGLFDAPLQHTVTQTVGLHDGVGSVRFELPPGAFAVRGFDQTQKLFDSTSGDHLDPAIGEQTDGPFFNPTHGEFEFRVQLDGGTWSVTAARQNRGHSIAVDETQPATEAGPWFDEAMEGDLLGATYRHGGPFHTEHGVLFIAPATHTTPFLLGSWDDAPIRMRTIAPGVAARFVDVADGEHTYEFFDPSTQSAFADPTNRFVQRHEGGFRSVLSPSGARTVWLPRVQTAELGAREVYVHLPASYDDSTRSYPTMYVHDGLNSMQHGQFDVVADEVGSLSGSLEAITVFISPSTTLAQTMSSNVEPASAYIDFVAGALVPYVDTSFRTRTERTARGTSGVSFGGVASFWTAVRHAETFGYTAGISAPLVDSEDVVIDELTTRGCQQVVFRVAASASEPGAMATSMRNTLHSLGCEFNYVTDTRRDDWASFGDRFADTMLDFANLHAF